MKNIFILLPIILLIYSCATTNRMANEAFYHTLIGQNEMVIYSRLGPPAKTFSESGGEKIMIYEYYGKGMFLTPYKSKIIYSPEKNISGDREGLIFRSGVNTETNDPEYTIHQQVVSQLKVILNKQGNCTRFEQNLTRDQLEMCYKRFKKYIPEN